MNFLFVFLMNKSCRRAKFEAELKAMQWLIKWEEVTTRTLLHNIVATPSFNKLSSSQKVSDFLMKFIFCLMIFFSNTYQDLSVQKSVSM